MATIIEGVPVDGPEASDRPRHWKAFLTDKGAPVTLLGYPVLADGEDLTEQLPQVRLPWDTWQATHADYGLAVDGTRLDT